MKRQSSAWMVVWVFAFVAGAVVAQRPPRSLLIAIDAVPYHVLAELTDPALGDDAYFQSFHPPVPLVSTFPSSTSIAMGGILGPLGLEKSPGYEARFFDWDELRVRGGRLFSYYKVEFPWRGFFDWGRKGPVGSSFEAIRPIHSGTKRLRKAMKDFVASDKEVFLIYVAATDTAAHVLQPQDLKRLVIDLDVMILEARAKTPDRPFEVIVFSDHGISGGEALINVLKPLKANLKQAGYRVAKKLDRPNTVALTPFGLVSSFEAYTDEAIIDEVADTLVGSEGIDLCAYREIDGIRVANSNGSALIQQKMESELMWHYDSSAGDPLSYAPEIEGLAQVWVDSKSWVRDRDLFEKTTGSKYPDGLYRISQAFELVTNSASIVCSVGPGYMFGSKTTARLAKLGKGRLRWTHGALTQQATMGFLMSDRGDWDPSGAVRFDEALLPFAEALNRRGDEDPSSAQK